MLRTGDKFIENTRRLITLAEKIVLEIGCGSGTYSTDIGHHCKHLIGIDPDASLITSAQQNNSRRNIGYGVGKAQNTEYKGNDFDVVMFTLSFHHIPFKDMGASIAEAIRITKTGGYIVFLEPGIEGSLYLAEKIFNAWDGDETAEKIYARSVILNHRTDWKPAAQFEDQVVLKFDSVQDFIKNLHPKNTGGLEAFLKQHNHTLGAKRFTNIFQVYK